MKNNCEECIYFKNTFETISTRIGKSIVKTRNRTSGEAVRNDDKTKMIRFAICQNNETETTDVKAGTHRAHMTMHINDLPEPKKVLVYESDICHRFKKR